MAPRHKRAQSSHYLILKIEGAFLEIVTGAFDDL
jgi:hypothetical protein